MVRVCMGYPAPPAVIYVGEREFADIKRRMGEIASFRPYKKTMCAGVAAAAALMIAAMLLVVYTHSYARNNECKDIISYDTEALSQMIPYESITDGWYFGLLKML